MLIELMHGIDIKNFIGDMFYILLGFVFFDVVTGLLRAGKDRKLNSSVNFDGLIRKVGILLGVVFLTFIDIYLGTDGLITKTGVGFLILYETISILENFKLIAVDFDFIMKYFDKEKYKKGAEKNNGNNIFRCTTWRSRWWSKCKL